MQEFILNNSWLISLVTNSNNIIQN